MGAAPVVVITADARGSGGSVAPIEAVRDAVARALMRRGVEAAVPFGQTLGDEIQGVLATPDAVVAALGELARHPVWVGVGVGPAPELRAEARLSGGAAFDRARRALDAAKARRGRGARPADPHGVVARWPVAVVAGATDAGAELEYACALLWHVVAPRSARQAAMVEGAEHGAGQAEIAAALGVAQSTVARGLVAAGLSEERAARHLLAGCAARALAAEAGR